MRHTLRSNQAQVGGIMEWGSAKRMRRAVVSIFRVRRGDVNAEGFQTAKP
jgi:hypothetical protein